MSFLARFLRGRSEPAHDTIADEADALAATPDAPEPTPEPPPEPPAPAAIPCPSCARLIDPPPVRTRKCPHCREIVVVRRTEGRTVYLTEGAVLVFEAERQREADIAAWTTQRAGWLRLARGVGAPEDRRRRIVARTVSAESVVDARALYQAAAAKARHAAARAGNLDVVARIGREEAAALYHAAGSPVPVPEDIAAVHAAAMVALLKSLKATGTHAEIVGGSCCPACRSDDGRAFAIKDEVRTPRLPHDGCPRGLCACEWWLGVAAPKRKRRRTPRPMTAGASPTDAPSVEPADVPG
jgi:hypothetical protein